jgi:hypothetical protein
LSVPESDWKTFRELQRVALGRFCKRTFEEAQTVVADRSPRYSFALNPYPRGRAAWKVIHSPLGK